MDRIHLEDALKHLFDCDERENLASLESVAGALQVPPKRAGEVLDRLLSSDLAEAHRGRFDLTERGRDYALHLVRAHRLWETYLARRTGVPEVEWHREAHSAEHKMSREEVDALARELGHPRFDPHGDPIPRKDGAMLHPHRVALPELPVGWEGVLAHVEDEPVEVYRRLAGEGTAPGMRIKILDRSGARLVVNLEGRVLELSPVEAACLECEPDSGPIPEGDGLGGKVPVMRLSDLPMGGSAEVESIAPACRGTERRRLLDLGIVPGSRVEVDFASPFKSPCAYYVRGTLIGLRREQADHIIVRPLHASAPN